MPEIAFSCARLEDDQKDAWEQEGTIEHDEMFTPLRGAYAGFKAQHDEFMAWWVDDTEAPPYYLLPADLARECSVLPMTDRPRSARSLA